MQSSQLTDWIECSLAFFGKERLFTELYNSCGSLQGTLDAAYVNRPSADVIERIISDCQHLGIEIITQADPAFPEAFFATKPPILLYAKGDVSTLAHKNTAGKHWPAVPFFVISFSDSDFLGLSGHDAYAYGSCENVDVAE